MALLLLCFRITVEIVPIGREQNSIQLHKQLSCIVTSHRSRPRWKIRFLGTLDQSCRARPCVHHLLNIVPLHVEIFGYLVHLKASPMMIFSSFSYFDLPEVFSIFLRNLSNKSCRSIAYTAIEDID